MYRSAKTGIELSGIILPAGPARPRYEIAPDPFGVGAGQAGVIVAPPQARSLLADVLVGLARPLRGEIRLNGTAVTGQAPGARGIALIPPGGGLLPHLTVERNVAFGLGGKTTRVERRAQVGDALARLELEGQRRRRPHQLSAEQVLRTAVARAICTRPATTAVVVEDRNGRPACRAAVVAAADQDLAVVMITGDRERAAGLASYVQGSCRPASLAET